MAFETVYEREADDGDSFDDNDLIEAIVDASNTAGDYDAQNIHYIETEDGRKIVNIRVGVETLSDGSKVSTIYLKVA